MDDYDLLNNITAIRENGATSGAGVLATYGYDNLARRISLSRGNGTSTTYSYDAVSRLNSLTQDLAGTANDITIGSITYNPASQIISQVRSNDAYAWTGHSNADRNYGSNGLNQYSTVGASSLGYDGRGNLTSSGASSYTYSKLNELKSGPSATLYYDGLGRLAEYDTSTSTRFVYSGGTIVAEVANPTGAVVRRYVPGAGVDQPITWYEGSGTTDRRWLHADERGSIIAISDGTGSALAINRYDEYGVPQATNAGRFQYTGQAWLPELGMYYYKARLYTPTIGRFMQTDPIGYANGLNWYNYAGSDPINSSDPSGLFAPPSPEDKHYSKHYNPGECTGTLICSSGRSMSSVAVGSWSGTISNVQFGGVSNRSGGSSTDSNGAIVVTASISYAMPSPTMSITGGFNGGEYLDNFAEATSQKEKSKDTSQSHCAWISGKKNIASAASDAAGIALTAFAPEARVAQLATASAGLIVAGGTGDVSSLGNGIVGYHFMMADWATLQSTARTAVKVGGRLSGGTALVNDAYNIYRDYTDCRAGQ